MYLSYTFIYETHYIGTNTCGGVTEWRYPTPAEADDLSVEHAIMFMADGIRLVFSEKKNLQKYRGAHRNRSDRMRSKAIPMPAVDMSACMTKSSECIGTEAPENRDN